MVTNKRMIDTDYSTSSSAEDSAVLVITRDDIFDFLRSNRWKILLAAIIGALVGLLYAFSKPNMYTAQVTVMPEIQAKGAGGLGSLGSLAGLAGVNIDNLGAQDAIRPDLYPNILQSVPFALKLLKQPVYSQKLNEKLAFQAFIERMDDGNLIDRFLTLFGGSGGTKEDARLDPENFSQAIQVTKRQDELIKAVQASVATAYDKKTGIITITVVEPDPVVAATISRLSLEYLTNYIISYRTEKARNQVEFLVERVADAQSRYKATEYGLSAYRDRNRSLFLNTAKIDEQRLQADYLLAQSVYTDLSKQLEQAKIKVQQETPVFKTLDPPTVPLQKSGPKRTVLVFVFSTVSIFISLIVSFIQHKW